MRILYLHQYFVPPSSAGGTRSYEFARRLVESGHQVRMITSTAYLGGCNKPENGNVFNLDGISITAVPVEYSNKMSFKARIDAFLRFAALASREATKYRADLVLATSTPLTIALPGLVAKAWQRIPMVFEVRDLWPDVPIAIGALRNPIAKSLAIALERVAYRSSTHIIALSPGMMEGIICKGVSPAKVSVIPNSCDIELFDIAAERGQWVRERLGITSSESPLLVYTGTFGMLNGVTYLVEVAAAMALIAPEIKFLLAGDGAERQQVVGRAQELGVLNQNLWVWDPLPKAKVPELLAAATVASSVFIPTEAMWDNSANKFFDALAAGRPIAINYGGWQADLLRETGAGVVLPPNDPYTAARTLSTFLADKGRLEAARNAARELARSQFDRNTLYRQLESVLLSAVNGQ